MPTRVDGADLRSGGGIISGDVGINRAPTAHLDVLGVAPDKPVIAGELDVYNSSGLAAGAAFRPFEFTAYGLATDLTAATQWSAGVHSYAEQGDDTTPAMGTVHAATNEVIVRNSGSQSNEYAAIYGAIRFDGNPFPSATPGRAWLADLKLHGPIGKQPGLLNGVSVFVNNAYNGAAASGIPMAGATIVTKPGSGSPGTSDQMNATTYPLDVGLGIYGGSGTTASPTATQGFKTALKVGGVGSPWSAASRFGTGLDISDWETAGINISGRFAGATGPAIQTAAGLAVRIGTNVAKSPTLAELLTIYGSGGFDPLFCVATQAASDYVSIATQNGAGTVKQFVSGGNDQFMTGTVAGDSGIAADATKTLHLGRLGTSAAIKIGAGLAFFGGTPAAKPTVTGSKGANAALTSLMSALSTLGLVTDSTT